VMCRVKLPALPASFTELLPSMRRAVRQHKAELMTPSKETLF